jgi:hypothetical protein
MVSLMVSAVFQNRLVIKSLCQGCCYTKPADSTQVTNGLYVYCTFVVI